jgi:hypothetical protein
VSRAGAIALLVAAVLLAGGAGVAEWLLPAPERTLADEVAQDPARSGAWYCPVTAEAEETAVLSVAAVGEEEAVVRVVRYPPSGPVADPPVTLTPGTQHDVRVDPGHATFPLSVRWEGGPAAAARRVTGGDDAAAPCVAEPSERWLVPGLDTADGARSRLHLFNPFRVDATVRVSFALPEGPVTLALTDNLVVPAASALSLDLQEYQPEQPDLGAVIETLAGRVVAAGETRFAPRGDAQGPRGRTLLPAVAEPGEEWTFPYARADEHAESWLSVLNPGEREAAIELRVTDPGFEGAALGELSVPAGGLVRIDLAETAAAPEFSVSIAGLNEVPVAVTRTTWLRTGDGREGVGATTGAASATDWALVGAGLGDRRGQIIIANPGVEEASVTVDAGEDAPDEWSSLVVKPNGRLTLDLSEAGLERSSVLVRVRGSVPLVAEVRSHAPAGGLRFWTTTGSPGVAWRGPEHRLPVRRDPSLATRPWSAELDDG